MRDFLAEAVTRRPGALAADDGARGWSWAELYRRAGSAEEVLRRLGAGPGRIVVISAHPSLEVLATLHGALRTGALVAPLHPDLAPPEREAALAALRPAVVVESDAEARTAFHPSLAPPGPATATGPDRPAGDVEGPMAVLWTSGTSGTPRGVLLSEAAFRVNAEASRRRLGLGPDDVWYASLSPAHVGGLALILRAALLGSALAVRGRFSVSELDALVDAGTVTHVSLVPTMLQRLLDARGGRPAPPTLRCVLVGGARAPAELVERSLGAGVPLALTYGLTEAASQVATAPPEEVRSDPEGVGAPLDGVEVRIDESGEILVRGPTVAVGFLDGRPATDDEGWLHTGDLGRLDARGRLRVTGRRSDRIVTGGATVDAHEVESVLRNHPGVADACVVGLPDAEWGERVVAAVRLHPGGRLDTAQLHRWLRSRLSAPKRPKEIRAVSELPFNPNGKIDRAAVRRIFDHPGA